MGKDVKNLETDPGSSLDSVWINFWLFANRQKSTRGDEMCTEQEV